jgi:lincosamide nucleotidyltransferase B/F
MKTQQLLKRLDDIGVSLERSGHALALIGLGSVGLERDRLDDFSDLDFFAIVEPGYKAFYLNHLEWLSSLGGIAFSFANTVDGLKLLYEDGIFCEFAVFEPEELSGIPFSEGRIIWKQANVSESIRKPVRAMPIVSKPSQEYLLGEALTNLYVGMGREMRGEKLSAMRFIQCHTVDRLIEMADGIDEAQASVNVDVFSRDRRFEQRHASIAKHLPSWTQGYLKNRESALAILAFLEQHFAVNEATSKAIRNYCNSASMRS